MTAFILPQGKQQYEGFSGNPPAWGPLVGGRVYTFDTGTNNPRTTWQDAAQTAPNVNPIVLDARGEATIFWSGAYRVRLEDALGNTVWTVDGVSAGIDELRSDLANLVSASLGARLVGFNPTLAYASSTVGGFLHSIYGRTAGEIAAAVTPVSYFYPPGHVLRYGTNTTPGTTDMTTAFQSAALSSLNPYAPPDTYLITGSIPLRDNQYWTLDGANITITGNTQVFTVAVGIDDWAIGGNWTVTGDNGAAGATAGTGAALKIIDSMRFRVGGLTAKNIKGWGILIQPGASASARAERGQIIAPQCFACYIGIEVQAGTGAEYLTIDTPIISRCNTGMKVAAGNTNVIGGSITDNTDGVSLLGGTNNAHGTFTGTDINHNTQYNVRSDGVTNGHFFVNCKLYEGAIYLKDSFGILFKSCTVDAANYYFQGSQGDGFIDCTLPFGYGNVIQNNFGGFPSYTIWENCKKLTGKNQGGAFGNIRGLRVECTSPGIAITPATLNAGTVLLLTDAANYSANNNAQTLFDGYVAATGIFTCRGLGDGRVNVTVLLNVASNAADDAAMATVFAFLEKNGAGVVQYFARTRVSTTSNKFSIDAIVEMSDTDTLRIRMGSTTVLANNISIAATETYAIVEGL
jgi:hypothetical protein